MEIPFEEKLEAGKRVVDLMDEDGNTCLMISCELGHYEVASYLLKKARCSLEVANHSGLTALHLASMFGKLECVQVDIHSSPHSFTTNLACTVVGKPCRQRQTELGGDQFVLIPGPPLPR